MLEERVKMSTVNCYLSLGSNLGDRHSLLLLAIDLLARRVGRLVRASSIIETEPWGYDSPHSYLNAVVLLQTTLTPQQLLSTTQTIERELGRQQKTPANSGDTLPPYSDRPIDIDILLYGDLQLSTPDLTIPHPRMHQRDFVMRPLREIGCDITPSIQRL
jgi:2-amino-4-hydroxy-6-hydroxymethyldihydropteridine diphosphokinase